MDKSAVQTFFISKPVVLFVCACAPADGDGFVEILAKDPQSKRGDVPQ